MAHEEVEREFDEFWRPLVCKPDGTLDVERVKGELCGYSRLMDRVMKVYGHVTGGRVSKPWASPEVVIAEADRERERAIEEAIRDERDWNSPAE